MFNRYYESELNKLQSLAVEFAHNNPALAPMLSGASTDPDVERLLEGVAFLTGLVRKKLDDEFPEFVQELANLLFPHYLRPVPASTLIEFTPKGPLLETVQIAADTELASVPVDGTACRFRTTHELAVQPLRIVDVNLLNHSGVAPILMMDFELQGLKLLQWPADNIRLFLGSGYAEASKLLLLLTQYVSHLRIVSDTGEYFDLGVKSLRASGFDHALLPYPSHAFSGFRNVQEFFMQSEKFLFIDIEGLRRWTERGAGSSFSLLMTLDAVPDWMPEIRDDNFILHVAPVINVFPYSADPIQHEHRATEYHVTPEGRNHRHYQVYAIDEVVGYQQGVAQERRYQPFDMHRHDGRGAQLSYRAVHRSVGVGQDHETFLSIHYPPKTEPLPETLSLKISCTNRSLPQSLKLGDINQPTGNSPDRMHFRNIRPVTPALNPPAGEALLWRLISSVSLNFLSVATAENLRTILNLCVFFERQEQAREMVNRRRINGIQQVSATPETRLIGRGGLLRGQLIRLQCRQDYYAGIGDMYLFGCLLERFFGDYAGINTYTRVELEDDLSGVSFTWPPRLGQQTLL